MMHMSSGTCGRCGVAVAGEHHSMTFTCTGCDHRGYACGPCSERGCPRCGEQILDSWGIVKHRTGDGIMFMETGLPSAQGRSTAATSLPAPHTSGSLVLQVFHLLADHCVHPGERQKFIQKVNDLLEASTLNVEDSVDSVWLRSWEKPLYADQIADVATKLLDRMRRAGPTPFDDFRQVRGTEADLKGLKRYTRKYRALAALAAAWPGVFVRHHEARRAALALLDADMPLSKKADKVREFTGIPMWRLRGAQDTLFHRIDDVWGFAKITTLHLLLDLGYPLYKPDRWLVRFAAVDLGTREEMERKRPIADLLSLSPERLVPHIDVIFRGMDKHTAALLQAPQPEGIVDLTVAFRAFRFCDLMVAKFGMTPEASFGLARSGITALLGDPVLAAKYPELHDIALAMSRGGSNMNDEAIAPVDG